MRLITESERDRFDQLLTNEHYLKNPTAVGQVLRYVAEYQGQWVALLVFSSAALHVKPRDRWLKWSARQVKERRHLIAQNARFLVLASAGRWPNLASRVLKLNSEWLPQDWSPRAGDGDVCGSAALSGHLLPGGRLAAAGTHARL